MSYGIVIYDVRTCGMLEKISVKAILSLLLGLMLLTSLAGFAYAAPTLQPGQSNGTCNSNDPNYNPDTCIGANNHNGANGNGNNDPNPGCDSKAPDSGCGCFSSNPLSPDSTCCGTSINPQNPQISTIQPDCPK